MSEFEKTEKSFEEVGNETTTVGVYTGQADNGESFIINLQERQLSFCSMEPKTDEERDILFIAMNSPEKRIKDCINEIIEIKDIFMEVVFLEDKNNPGFKNPAPRTVIIDSNGVGYQAVSLGIYSAVKKMIDTYGNPNTWAKPKKFKVLQISKSADRSILTFVPVITKKK